MCAVHLGSVQVIVDDIGNVGGVLEAYRYTEYGEVQFCAGNGTYYSPNASLGAQDITYTGREWMSELGKFYYRFRIYGSESGFLSRDPLRSALPRSLYDYADWNPIDLTDPLGLQSERRMESMGQSLVNLIFGSSAPAPDPIGDAVGEATRAAGARVALSGIPGGGYFGWRNGPGNAMEHCYWSCLMACDQRVGPEEARRQGQLKENRDAGGRTRDLQRAVESAQDMHNNSVGIACCEARQDCWTCCRNALSNGGLIFFIPEGTVVNKHVRAIGGATGSGTGPRPGTGGASGGSGPGGGGTTGGGARPGPGRPSTGDATPGGVDVDPHLYGGTIEVIEFDGPFGKVNWGGKICGTGRNRFTWPEKAAIIARGDGFAFF